ncbi:sugar transferase [Amycolatopsis cihanbeyliensis]|uniref:Undecaprenyl-phosphate galactose phosphotransferase WbaP/exopolysaccharide biosynthesis polyprenyl glycosylphosphotransferase n=1 Tax=Amycolatopsis cihanbeyliensis TaxID=1128664 RepID=A0A542DDY1_AMYCI|nr:sugar transferase [Amycolatopsis cihanbeyliensis]TQJ01285.1 Undecaprenyl-phosphate galactose phosphotransferase WbaP/exopolysaccharide biosynthesis polyprenyl glycosylphosphotransferase [Amycolatopsis cihanbeyliensis]
MDESARSSSIAEGISPRIAPSAARPVPSAALRPARHTAPRTTTRPPTMAWERRYRAWVIGGDALSTLLLVAVSAAVIDAAAERTDHVLIGLGVACAVLLALPAGRAWTQQVLGEGAEEFRRLGKGLFAAGVVVAMAGLLFGALDVRPWVFLVMPALAALLLPQRYLLRRLLHLARRRGRCLLPVMAAGDPETVRELIERTRLVSHMGWRVEAVCTPEGTQDQGDVNGVPVVGRLEELADHVQRGGYRVVAITADRYWSPRRLQRLAWDLENTSAEMVVAPVLMEVAGPRLNVSGVFGMPLVRVAAPQFTGGRRLVKEIVDRAGSALLLTMLGPLLLLIALAIKFGDRGPVIYRQRRVGRDGATFTMLKFRTMVVDADRVRDDLLAHNEAAGPLFKLRQDPRVTRIGALLRRYSLDEFPQLWNVLSGRMSLVGPRPPLLEETEAYSSDAQRRLLVKPGLTGLWQVSGRSDLTWAESIRLDLRYVEDWSLAMDLVILWKTVRAVVVGQGAY